MATGTSDVINVGNSTSEETGDNDTCLQGSILRNSVSDEKFSENFFYLRITDKILIRK
jgi:hypothetical protein